MFKKNISVPVVPFPELTENYDVPEIEVYIAHSLSHLFFFNLLMMTFKEQCKISMDGFVFQKLSFKLIVCSER